MRALVVFFTLLAVGECLIPVDLPDSFLAAHPPPINQASGDPCIDTVLRSAQFGFNTALGINTALDWTASATFARAIDTILRSGVGGLLQVCPARTKFYQHLSTTYNNCINRFYLIATKGVSVNDAYQYVQVFNHLDFICNGGFEQSVNNWQCILNILTLPVINQCIAAFNVSIHQNPNGLCADATVFLDCVRAPFALYCGETVSWWACEDTRIGFVEFCSNLRCLVGGNSFAKADGSQSDIILKAVKKLRNVV